MRTTVGTTLGMLAALTVAMAGLGCGAGAPGAVAADGASSPPPVEAVRARTGQLPLVERLSGVARAWNQVEVRSEISGVVDRVPVENGDAVRRGDRLVVLRGETQREQLQQAEAAVRLAEASVAEALARVDELQARTVRARALAAQQLISELELETLEAQLAAARAGAAAEDARVAQARATADERRAEVERTVLRSPIDGRVGRRRVEPGQRIDPGLALFVVGDLDRIRVEVPLTESMLGYLAPGQPVTLSSPSSWGSETVAAELSRISPFLAEGSFSTVGEIDVDNRDGRIKPGMFLTVDVGYGETRRATLVPTSTLWEDPTSGAWFAFVVVVDGADEAALPDVDGRELSAEPLPVERRTIEVVAEGRGVVGVSAIEEGEWVVTVGQQLLAADGVESARLRPVSWEHVEALQRLQREDLLRRFLQKQRRVARERGAVPPSNEEYVGDAAPADPATR